MSSASDPLFTALARTFNVDNSTALRTMLADRLEGYSVLYRELFVSGSLAVRAAEEQARRQQADSLPEPDNRAQDRRQRLRFDEWMEQETTARLKKAAADLRNPEINFAHSPVSDDDFVHTVLPELLGDQFEANTVLEYPTGSPPGPRFRTGARQSMCGKPSKATTKSG